MRATPLAGLRRADLPIDLAAETKRLAKDRKIVRLLDDVSSVPFVAALATLDRCQGIDPTEVALFTVSEHDYAPPPPSLDDEGFVLPADEQARRCCDNANPAAWLAGMPNSAICQMSIVGRLHGPNLHLVGAGGAAAIALVLAQQALDGGDAQLALLVGYSPNGGTGETDVATLALRSAAPDDPPNPVEPPSFERTTTMSAAEYVGHCLSTVHAGLPPVAALDPQAGP